MCQLILEEHLQGLLGPGERNRGHWEPVGHLEHFDAKNV